jgi:hypothetical protein
MIFNDTVHRDMQTVKHKDHRDIMYQTLLVMIKQASVTFVFLSSCPLWLNNKILNIKP